eukprot:6210339-Pyramimonas_sp.AAC.1
MRASPLGRSGRGRSFRCRVRPERRREDVGLGEAGGGDAQQLADGLQLLLQGALGRFEESASAALARDGGDAAQLDAALDGGRAGRRASPRGPTISLRGHAIGQQAWCLGPRRSHGSGLWTRSRN